MSLTHKLQHYTEIKRHVVFSERFRVACSCGYVSRWFLRACDAERDADEHAMQGCGHDLRS